MKRQSICFSIAVLFCALGVGCDQPNLRGAVPSGDVARELRQELATRDPADSGGSSASSQKRTGWATLSGTIKVSGGVPDRQPLQITKQQDVCAPGGGPVLSEAVVVEPSTGALVNVAFYALDLSGDNVHPDAKAGKKDEVLFDQEKCVFLTHLKAMQATQTLKILNSDPVSHNTEIRAKRARSINENIPPKSHITYVPGKPEKEPVPVSCAIHPWMRAYLLPRDDSYFSVSNQSGEFEIANLPAGVDLSVQVWQETLGKNFKDIKVNGQPTTWKRGRLELKGEDRLKDGENRVLNVEIPLSLFQ